MNTGMNEMDQVSCHILAHFSVWCHRALKRRKPLMGQNCGLIVFSSPQCTLVLCTAHGNYTTHGATQCPTVHCGVLPCPSMHCSVVWRLGCNGAAIRGSSSPTLQCFTLDTTNCLLTTQSLLSHCTPCYL